MRERKAQRRARAPAQAEEITVYRDPGAPAPAKRASAD
jgi:hypothetical protein